jgi:hypothetical protein
VVETSLKITVDIEKARFVKIVSETKQLKTNCKNKLQKIAKKSAKKFANIYK